jgi:hypothetical protein
LLRICLPLKLELSLALFSVLPYFLFLRVFDVTLVLCDRLKSTFLGCAVAGESLLDLVFFLVFTGYLDHECHVLGLATSAMEVTLELFFLRDEGLNVLFVHEDFLREGKSKTFSLLGSTRITIFKVMDEEETVLTSSE